MSLATPHLLSPPDESYIVVDSKVPQVNAYRAKGKQLTAALACYNQKGSVVMRLRSYIAVMMRERDDPLSR